MMNLKNSFPNLNQNQHVQISKRFYKHLCDIVLDTLMTFTVSKKRLLNHISCKNPELINKYYSNGQSVIIAIGHYNSWEFFLAGLNALIESQVVVIYMPLTNKFMNRKMKEAREAFNTQLVGKDDVKNFFSNKPSSPNAIIFAIDQWPGNSSKAYWLNFLNQDTAVAYGAEKYAREYDLPVLYARIHKVKRGHYSIEFEEIIQKSKETNYGFITEAVTKTLEKDIINKPEFWLWSHNRWKTKPNQ